MSAVHVCTGSDMHPYNCNGKRGGCVHCLAKRTKGHAPSRCWLCCDGDPKGFPGVAASFVGAQRRRDRLVRQLAGRVTALLRTCPEPAARIDVLMAACDPWDLHTAAAHTQKARESVVVP